MISNTKYLEKTDYFEILDRVSKKALSEKGSIDINNILPLTDLGEISKRHRIYNEISTFFRDENIGLPDYIYIFNDDIAPAEKGVVLSAQTLYAIAKTISNYFVFKKSFTPIRYRSTAELFSVNTLNNSFYLEILKYIDKDGFVSSDASRTLYEIRAAISYVESRIYSVTQSIFKELKTADYTTEDIITVREGYNCIAVKSKFKNRIDGVVMDTSNTGQTSFIVPKKLFEAYSELNLQHELEKREIRNILRSYTGSIADDSTSLRTISSELLEFDIYYAIYRYGSETDARSPKLSDRQIISLINAKHPKLIDKCVPLNITLDNDIRTVIITGPNTGGKTVVLKTLGLFSALVQSGIPINADEDSVFGVFDGIFIDMGDEQSIDNSLSTFSSHILKLKDITANCTDRSLVLLDELGAGTDPDEGTALAISIIRYIHNRKSLCLVSTHFNGLKYFAEQESFVENASMEFNPETYQPTYRLIMGLPGHSKAIEISRILGMPETIISEARGLLNESFFDFEKIYNELHRKNSDITVKLEEVKLLKTRLERELEEAKKSEETYRDKAKILKQQERELEDNFLKRSRKEFEQLVKNIRESNASKESIKESLNYFESNKKRLDSESFNENRKNSRHKNLGGSKKPNLSESIEVGDRVKIISSGLTGTVTGTTNNKDEYSVQVGIVRTNFMRTELDKITEPKAKEPAKKTVNYNLEHVALSIDVRGLRYDEAEKQVDRFIERAMLNKLSEVKIVHGKGTGALKQCIYDLLSRSPFVTSFDFENHPTQGKNYGVTVAILV